MNKVLKTAVLGLGRIAWGYHIPQICAHPGFELTAVMDPCVERLEEAKVTFGVAHCFTDLNELLQSQKPDLVVITSPTMFHAAQAVAAMRHGCDVFCDKPLTPSLDDAKLIFRTAHETGRKVMTYQPHRINAEAFAVKAILESGKLGAVYLVERHIGRYVRRKDWQALACHGGGMLLNYGSHYIDQLLYLTRERVEHVRCDLRRIASLGDADDVVKAMLTTRQGTLLEIDINQAVALPLPEWRICGQHGTAVYEDGKWHLRYFKPHDLTPAEVDTGLAAAGRRYPEDDIVWTDETFTAAPVPDSLYYDYCHEYFAQDRPPLVSEEEIIELIGTIEECGRSAPVNRESVLYA